MLTAEEQAAWFARRGAAQLRELLHWRWDPIDLVPDTFPATWDEYDAYVPGVMAVLREHEDEDAVAAAAAVEVELTRVETTRIGLSRRDADRTARAAREIADWYRRATESWDRRGEGLSTRWRADRPRKPAEVVPLEDPAPPPLDGATPAIALDPAAGTATLAWRGATLTLSGVLATSVGPSHPLRAAPPGIVSEVLGSRWLRSLADIRRVALPEGVRHLVLPLGDGLFFECACEGVALS